MNRFSSDKISVGISSCLLGQEVRYDGGHKQSRFCRVELAEFFSFEPTCPEMAIGMGSPRKAIRLVQDDQRISLQASDGSFDVTEKMHDYTERRLPQLGHLSGYIVCAKSPSCGMERVSVYHPQKNNATKDGSGLFTAKLMQAYPLLPVEEDGRLNDPLLRENFINRVFAYHEWKSLADEGLSVAKVQRFHAKFKYLLMAHHPEKYRHLGPLVANLNGNHDQSGFNAYIAQFMAILKHNCSRKNHCNVLLHLQGYFKRELNPEQRQELSERIHQYREGLLPLLVPISLIQHYLREHPNHYVAMQAYLNPHPNQLKLRYSL
ncbi:MULTISPECIES: YbgA family protein [unclassified Agarivorans]|uniref:YbgA family protein n=1 Tax=unclassified Agarivorans TaxID=2636026 RepID=UPI003D7E1D35